MVNMANMTESLENVIRRLLENTTNEGQDQGLKEMKGHFKNPMVNVSLCNLIAVSELPEVRRYSAFMLRRRLLKSRSWKKIAPDVQQGLKQMILEAYIKDNEKVVRNAIAELIGVIAKHELSIGKWPELMELLNQSIRSNNVTDREVGLYSLSVITKAVGQKLKPQYKSLLSLFQNTLADRSTVEIPYYTLKALTHMVCHIGTEELTIFQGLMPNIMMTIKLLATTDQEKAGECMEIFDELLECEVAIIAPHIKSLIELCLELASTEDYEDELRIKAISNVAYLIRLKKKTVIKHRLTQPILDVLFPLMCRPYPGEKDEEDDEERLEISLPSAAGQALDVMALHLPPVKFIPLLMHHLEPAIKSQNPQHKKAAYLAISVIAEGCSEFIRYKHLPNFVQVICDGIKDPDAIVRNAALYALGQYAEYLQPDISKYTNELLPVLCNYLQQTCLLLQQGNKKVPSLMRTFYAVERFCENMEDIAPYLPSLMSCLTAFLTLNANYTAKELAVDAIGSVVTAAKELFQPYFVPVIDQLKTFIAEKQTEDTRPLQIQSIDTLAIIARSVGKDLSANIAHECVKYGMVLMEENDDPDIRRACYSLFSSVSTVLKGEMAVYLSPIVERMLVTLKSTEGISVSSRVDNTGAFALFEGEDEEETENGDMNEDVRLEEDEEDDDDDDDEVTGYSVENSYMEEKEGACLALKEMCEEIGLPFLPFIEAVYNEVRKLVESPSDEVRTASITALGQFCFTLHQVHVETGNLECRAALESNLNVLLPKLYSLAREDTEHTVVIACFETLQNVVDKLQQMILYGGNLESMCALIKDAFCNKLACQDEEGSDEDEQEAEYDSIVIENAGELIACLIKVVPWQQFGPYLAGLMPFLFARTKKACTVPEKSFAVGTLADIVSSMQPGTIQPFVPHLQPVFLAGMKDDNEEVRSNSVYGLGVFVEAAGELIYDQYPTYLQALSNIIATEEDPRAKDNICGAVARLIKTNVNLVPMAEVFPVLLKSLPLRVDLDENNTVLNCLVYLHSIRSEFFFNNLPEILKIISEALASQKLNEGIVSSLSVLVKSVSIEFPADFENVVNSLPQVNAEVLIKVRSV